MMNIVKIKERIRVIALAFEIELRQNLTDGFVLFGILIQPLIVAFLALWMLKDKGAEHAIFVVVGSGMTGLWTTLLFNGGNSVRHERNTGTLEALVASPASLRLVVFGKILANVIQSLGSMIFSYIVISLIFHYPLAIAQPVLFFTSLGLTVFAFACFGLILASLFILIPNFQRMQNSLEFPVYILCGFLFPIALLPGWTTPLSYLLSPYWAAQALHGAARAALPMEQILFAWLMLVVFSGFYLLLSRRLYAVILYRTRVDATLNAMTE